MFKKGSRANWDLNHRKHVKYLLEIKEQVKRKQKRLDEEFKKIDESVFEDDEWDTLGETPDMQPKKDGFSLYSKLTGKSQV